MRVDISYKNLEKSEFIENIFDNNLRKVERRIKIFKRDDPIHIAVNLEKNTHREQYFCSAHIYLPSKVLKAEEKGDTLSFAINKTFGALSKQLDKVKHKLESHLRKK